MEAKLDEVKLMWPMRKEIFALAKLRGMGGEFPICLLSCHLRGSCAARCARSAFWPRYVRVTVANKPNSVAFGKFRDGTNKLMINCGQIHDNF